MAKFQLTFLAAVVTSVLGHGVITTPPPRQLGPAALAACGTGAFNSLKSNIQGPIESAVKAADSSFNPDACNLFLCRGNQLADNINNTRTLAPGSTLDVHVNIAVRHTGFANVSVVHVPSQTLIGGPLFNWPVYADASIPAAEAPANETDFSVTIPDLGTQCSEVGACAIQWWWFGSSVSQTYESCIDFTQ